MRPVRPERPGQRGGHRAQPLSEKRTFEPGSRVSGGGLGTVYPSLAASASRVDKGSGFPAASPAPAPPRSICSACCFGCIGIPERGRAPERPIPAPGFPGPLPPLPYPKGARGLRRGLGAFGAGLGARVLGPAPPVWGRSPPGDSRTPGARKGRGGGVLGAEFAARRWPPAAPTSGDSPARGAAGGRGGAGAQVAGARGAGAHPCPGGTGSWTAGR